MNVNQPEQPAQKADAPAAQEQPVPPVQPAKAEVVKQQDKAAESEPGQTVDVTVWFSRHQTEEDAQGLVQLIPDADLVTIEQFAWNARDLPVLQELSAGRISTADALRRMSDPDGTLGDVPDDLILALSGGFSRTFFDAIHGSGKEILPLDVGKTAEGTAEMEAKADVTAKALDPALINSCSSFEDFLDKYAGLMEEFGTSQAKREEAIADNLVQALTDPNLRDRSHIRLLIQLGSAHTGVAREIKRRLPHATIRSERPSGRYSYEYFTEGMRRARFGVADSGVQQEGSGREGAVLSRTFMMKVLGETLLGDILRGQMAGLALSDQNRVRLLRTATDRLTEENMRDLFVAMQLSAQDVSTRFTGDQDEVRSLMFTRELSGVIEKRLEEINPEALALVKNVDESLITDHL